MVNLILGPVDVNDIPRFLLGIVIASIVIDRFDCTTYYMLLGSERWLRGSAISCCRRYYSNSSVTGLYSTIRTFFCIILALHRPLFDHHTSRSTIWLTTYHLEWNLEQLDVQMVRGCNKWLCLGDLRC